MHRYILTFLWLSSLAFAAIAQTKADSLGNRKYWSGSFAPAIKEKLYRPDSTHKPYKAVIRSLLLPGLGQMYNGRWWKPPVIYGGMGLLGSAIIFNQNNYTENLALTRLLQDRLNNNDPSSVQSNNHKLYLQYKNKYELYVKRNVTPSQTQAAFENHKRNRDLSIMGFVAVWAINVIDAYIDAKFIHSFSVDNNLTINTVSDVSGLPVYADNRMGSFNPRLKITFAMR
jgi:hypothetical protein